MQASHFTFICVLKIYVKRTLSFRLQLYVFLHLLKKVLFGFIIPINFQYVSLQTCLIFMSHCKLVSYLAVLGDRYVWPVGPLLNRLSVGVSWLEVAAYLSDLSPAVSNRCLIVGRPLIFKPAVADHRSWKLGVDLQVKTD